VDGAIVNLNVPAGSMIELGPPELSAAWTAARSVQLELVETHVVVAGPSGASPVSFTVNVAATAAGATHRHPATSTPNNHRPR
jgi:hypothetical protein